jgi:hypothetical protein
MWIYTSWNKNIKWGVSIFWGFIFLVGVLNKEPSSPSSPHAKSKPIVQQVVIRQPLEADNVVQIDLGTGGEKHTISRQHQRQNRNELAPSRGRDSSQSPKLLQSGKGIIVTLSADLDKGPDGRARVVGKTNLPNGVELTVTLRDDVSNYQGQDSVYVTDGFFVSNWFSFHGEPLPAGTYEIVVVSPHPRKDQSETLRELIGEEGENLLGALSTTEWGAKTWYKAMKTLGDKPSVPTASVTAEQENQQLEVQPQELTQQSQVQAGDAKANLFEAAGDGELERVKTLIAAGADVNAKESNFGKTALMIASDEGHVEVVKALLAARADVNAKDSNRRGGYTALMIASINGKVEVVRLLLAAGADVNAKDNFGSTALMAASTDGQVEVVKALLAVGADVNAKDDRGYTALKDALNMLSGERNALKGEGDTYVVELRKTVELLKQAGAKE